MFHAKIISLLIVSLVVQVAQAKVVYVNKNAVEDVHDGTSWATACLTVQAGIDAAASGDEVWVAMSAPAAEIYVENITIWQYGLSMYGGFEGTETTRSQRDSNTYETALVAANADSSVVRALNRLCTIDGFSIKKGIVGVEIQGTATVLNCDVSENNFGIAVVQGTGSASNCTISGNGCGVWVGLFSRNTVQVSNSIITGNGDGVYAEDGTAMVSNCNISGNSRGVYLQTKTAIAVVSSCTISGNNEGVFVDNGAATVNNSIVSYNGTGISRDSPGDSVSLSHDDVFGNTKVNYYNIADPTGTNGNISADPMFINRTGLNYRLQTDSPCIDAGDDSVVRPGDVDLDGQPRIQGAHVDMGAYEFAGDRPPYVLSEAVSALKTCAGLLTVSAGDKERMDVDSDNVVTILDAARITRKVAGREANP